MSTPTQPLIQIPPLECIRQSKFSLNEMRAKEIVTSLKQQGQLSPILARPIDDVYELVFGNQRFVAARLLNWTVTRCEIWRLPIDRDLSENLLDRMVGRFG